MNRADLQRLAEERLGDSQVLFEAGRFSAAYYLAGYVVEFALKACIAAYIKEGDVPEKGFVDKFYRHDLNGLRDTAGLKPAFEALMKEDREFDRNWATVKDWTEASRYGFRGDKEARDMIAAVSDPEQRSIPMYTTLLDKDVIEKGKRLLAELKRQKLPIAGALWLYLEESARWRLYIISPLVGDAGPREAYGRLQAALSQLPGANLSLSDISVVGVGEGIQSLAGEIKGKHLDASAATVRSHDMMFENDYIYEL
ncbi:MAG: HEPN domain-containing protein [Terriglobia bacterium]